MWKCTETVTDKLKIIWKHSNNYRVTVCFQFLGITTACVEKKVWLRGKAASNLINWTGISYIHMCNTWSCPLKQFTDFNSVCRQMYSFYFRLIQSLSHMFQNISQTIKPTPPMTSSHIFLRVWKAAWMIGLKMQEEVGLIDRPITWRAACLTCPVCPLCTCLYLSNRCPCCKLTLQYAHISSMMRYRV